MSEIQKATVRQLAYKIKGYESGEPDLERAPQFAFFLGAGASYQSGIKTAAGMIDDFRKRIFDAECPPDVKTGEDKEQWLKVQPWYDDQNVYASLFERCEPSENERQIYIENMIEGRKPSFGYVVLANLIADGYVDTILTTNFDDLVYIACTNYTDIRPIVFAYGVLASEMRVRKKRPKILKLHGDYLYSKLRNTVLETGTQDKNMKEQVTQILSEYGLVVFGYSGNDKSVIATLGKVADKKLYWCVPTGREPIPAVRALLQARIPRRN